MDVKKISQWRPGQWDTHGTTSFEVKRNEHNVWLLKRSVDDFKQMSSQWNRCFYLFEMMKGPLCVYWENKDFFVILSWHVDGIF